MCSSLFPSQCMALFLEYAVLCLVTQSCPTLCHPIDCSPPDSSVYGDSPGKNTGGGCYFLLQGIFPTQGSNPGLPHCRQTPTRKYSDKGKENSAVSKWGCSEGGGTGGKTKMVQAWRGGTSGKREPSAGGMAHGSYLCSS